MNILMPLGPGYTISKDVLNAIFMQTVQCFLCVKENLEIKEKRSNEMANRNDLKRFASAPYTLCMDSNVILSSPFDVNDMVNFMNLNDNYDAVALDTKGINIDMATIDRHVVIACMMVRFPVLQQLTFRQEKNECLCYCVNRDIRICYLDSRRLTEAPDGK